MSLLHALGSPVRSKAEQAAIHDRRYGIRHIRRAWLAQQSRIANRSERCQPL